MRKIIILRHGKTEWNDLGKIQGKTNTVLSPEGRNQISKWQLPSEYQNAENFNVNFGEHFFEDWRDFFPSCNQGVRTPTNDDLKFRMIHRFDRWKAEIHSFPSVKSRVLYDT